MINIAIYHNSEGGASKAANAALACIKQQIEARIVDRQEYSSLLPIWPNLREYGTQLCCVEVVSETSRDKVEEIRRSFENPGFESKIALVIQHHDDQISQSVAEFIRWRISRLISPTNMLAAVGVKAQFTPPCIPILIDLAINYYCFDVDALTEPNWEMREPTERIVGAVIPTVSLDHCDLIDLYGLGQPIDRAYLQHPMDVEKSVIASLVPRNDDYVLVANQFNQTQYQSQRTGLLLTHRQTEKFFHYNDSSPTEILTGDTPIDLFYEMLFLLYNDAI